MALNFRFEENFRIEENHFNLDYLAEIFPNYDKQILEEILSSCGSDLEATISSIFSMEPETLKKMEEKFTSNQADFQNLKNKNERLALTNLQLETHISCLQDMFPQVCKAQIETIVSNANGDLDAATAVLLKILEKEERLQNRSWHANDFELLSKFESEDENLNAQSSPNVATELERNQSPAAKLEPRAYQLEAARAAFNQNTIINIKTGGGKTFIAVLVIDHYLKESPEKLVLFIVPTRVLVEQQANYLRFHCSNSETGQAICIQELSGQEIERWGKKEWLGMIRCSSVLVGTPEIFRRVFVDQGFINPRIFSLIVFDECHGATGNSPMACLMRDAIHSIPVNERPRILGLTASFINGALGNMVKKRQKLEELLLSNIISPDIDDTVDSKSFEAVNTPVESVPDCKEWVCKLVIYVLSSLPDHLITQKEKDCWASRGWTVFEGLGTEGLIFWLREGIVLQLVAFADQLEKVGTFGCQQKAKLMRANVGNIKRRFSDPACVDLLGEAMSSPLPKQTQKLICLLNLLRKLYEDHKEKCLLNQFRGIVFVEQVAMTYPLAYMVNRFFAISGMRRCVAASESESSEGMSASFAWPMRPISGAGSMLDNVRNENMQLFREGRIALLVSTAATEEGVDVPNCSFVIRYDKLNTTKAHIQGSGRARNRHSKVYYFVNDPHLECAKASALDAIAKDSNLNLSSEEIQKRLAESRSKTIGEQNFYPFVPPAGSEPNLNQVNFFNCITILYEYVQRTMHQVFDPEHSLFKIIEQEVCVLPPQRRKMIVQVTFPTPDGLMNVNAEQVNEFWKGYKVEDIVVPPDRLRNLDDWDKEKRRAAYVVVVKLHQNNFLDASNQPTANALYSTRNACPAYVMKPRIKIKNTFKKESLAFDITSRPSNERVPEAQDKQMIGNEEMKSR